MDLYENRKAAGELLAKRIEATCRPKNAIVLAIPRGGVAVGRAIANYLKLDLDVICPRKIARPKDPEVALGCVTETGVVLITPELKEELHDVIEKQCKEAHRRALLYRQGRKDPNIAEKQVILVDDGAATGLTMLGAIASVTALKADEIIVAVACAPPNALAYFKGKADKVICPIIDPEFRAVSQYYESFEQLNDEDVIDLLDS